MKKLRDSFEDNKKWLYFALAATFLWGLAAHGYGFTNNSFSHDSLTEFDGADWSNIWKMKLGRVLVPLYRWIFRTELTLPWLIGLLSLLWIGLSVFLALRLFKIESKMQAFLVAGIFTVNITVSAVGSTYLHDLDCNMFALLCSVGAACCWNTGKKRWFLLGAVLTALSLGIYQSYVSVSVVLIMFVCILELLNEAAFLDVLKKGLKAIGMLLLGGILYYGLLQIALHVTGIELSTGGSNSLDQMQSLNPMSLLRRMGYAYYDFVGWLWKAYSPFPDAIAKTATVLLGSIVVAAALVGLCSKKLGRAEKLLCTLLFFLLPLAMNLMYVLTNGAVHYLMVYAVWLSYLLALLMARWLCLQMKGEKWQKALRGGSLLLVAVLMYGNVQTANALYLKKDMEQDAFLSMMTRIVYRMEDCDEYISGETPVVFVGRPEQLRKSIPGFEKYKGITGHHMLEAADTSENYRIRRYFEYVLGTKDITANDEIWNTMCADPRVKAMPLYPHDDCIAMLDGVLVVKLGEND